MRRNDCIMIIVSLVAMAAGSLLPALAEPLAFLPRLSLMLLLFFSFLAVGTEALVSQIRLTPGRVLWLTGLRLFLIPLFAFAVFEYLMPSFALGALLVAGTCIGVVAPVFCSMVKAEMAFTLIGCLTTAFLLPLSLPTILWFAAQALAFLGLPSLALPEQLSLWGIMASLGITILIPFGISFFVRNGFPRTTVFLLKHQFYLSTLAIFFSTLAIFSHYSAVLHNDPFLVLQAIGAACMLGGLMMVPGLLLPRSLPPKTRLAFLVAFGTMNNVLMLIVSIEFFGVHEALIAAMYLIPLNLLLFVYRALSRKWQL